MEYLLLMVVLVGAESMLTDQTTPAAVSARSNGKHRSNGEILLRLEEKIRGMEAVTYAVKLARMDYVLDQLNRRVEGIESQMNSLQYKIESKLEKIEEAVFGHIRKDELNSEQTPRKIETASDKILNKLSIIETKVDLKIDNLSSKFERNERQLQNSLDNVLEKIAKNEEKQSQTEALIRSYSAKSEGVVKEVNELQTYIKEEFTDYLSLRLSEMGAKLESNAQRIDVDGSKFSDVKIEKLVSLMESMNNRTCHDRGRGGQSQEGNKTQINNLTDVMADALRFGARKFQELDNDMEVYTRKVLNIYQDLLKSSRENEGYLKDALKITNQTNLAVKDGFRRLYQRITPFTALRSKMEELLEGVQMKMMDLDVSVDSSFASLLVAQNAFIASCQRIQHQEPQMEHKIYSLLQQLVGSQNNSNNTEGATNNILMSMLTNHNLQVGKALNDLVWTILTADNQSKEEMRKVINRLNSMQHDSSSSCLIKRGEWDNLISACESLPPKQKIRNKIKPKIVDDGDKSETNDDETSSMKSTRKESPGRIARKDELNSEEIMSDDGERDKLLHTKEFLQDELNKYNEDEDYVEDYTDVYVDPQ